MTVALSALTQGVGGKDACKRLAVCYHNLHLVAHRPLDGAARGFYLLLQLVLLVFTIGIPLAVQQLPESFPLTTRQRVNETAV